MVTIGITLVLCLAAFLIKFNNLKSQNLLDIQNLTNHLNKSKNEIETLKKQINELVHHKFKETTKTLNNLQQHHSIETSSNDLNEVKIIVIDCGTGIIKAGFCLSVPPNPEQILIEAWGMIVVIGYLGN